MTRDELILTHWKRAELTASYMLRRLPPHCQTRERNDYMSEAALALIEAVDSYRPDRGATMSTYVTSKVQWAIQTWRQRIDPATRRTRQNEKDGIETGVSFTSQNGKRCWRQSLPKITQIDEANEKRLASLQDTPAAIDQSLTVDKLSRLAGEIEARGVAVVEDYYMRDRTLAEIAAERGCTPKTAFTWREQGLKAMRAAAAGGR